MYFKLIVSQCAVSTEKKLITSPSPQASLCLVWFPAWHECPKFQVGRGTGLPSVVLKKKQVWLCLWSTQFFLVIIVECFVKKNRRFGTGAHLSWRAFEYHLNIGILRFCICLLWIAPHNIFTTNITNICFLQCLSFVVKTNIWIIHFYNGNSISTTNKCCKKYCCKSCRNFFYNFTT